MLVSGIQTQYYIFIYITWWHGAARAILPGCIVGTHSGELGLGNARQMDNAHYNKCQTSTTIHFDGVRIYTDHRTETVRSQEPMMSLSVFTAYVFEVPSM